MISNNEKLYLYIDFDDGSMQNFTMCDSFFIFYHIYSKEGNFTVKVKSIGDHLYQEINLAGKFSLEYQSVRKLKILFFAFFKLSTRIFIKILKENQKNKG